LLKLNASLFERLLKVNAPFDMEEDSAYLAYKIQRSELVYIFVPDFTPRCLWVCTTIPFKLMPPSSYVHYGFAIDPGLASVYAKLLSAHLNPIGRLYAHAFDVLYQQLAGFWLVLKSSVILKHDCRAVF